MKQNYNPLFNRSAKQSELTQSADDTPYMRWLWYFIFFVAIVVAFFVHYAAPRHSAAPGQPIYSDGTTHAIQTEYAAWTISKQFLQPYLKAPSTADFPYAGMRLHRKGDTYAIVAYVDAQNSYGAMLREIYTCQMTFNGGETFDLDNWTLIEITINGKTI